MSTWVKLSRKLATSAIAAKPEYLAVWVHLLMAASYKEGEILVGRQVVRLLPGQLVFGRHKFSEKTGVSENIVRSALKVLENLQQITIKSESKFSIISITKWSHYQADEPTNNQQRTSNAPATHHNKEIQEIQEEDQKLLSQAEAFDIPQKKIRKKKIVEGLVSQEQIVSEGCDQEHARDWLIVRKSKKADLTPTAWAAMHREAAKAGITIGQAVQIAAERGWQAFNSTYSWRNQNASGSNPGRNGKGSVSLVEKVRLANAHLFAEQPPPVDERDWSEFDSIREVNGHVMAPDD